MFSDSLDKTEDWASYTSRLANYHGFTVSLILHLLSLHRGNETNLPCDNHFDECQMFLLLDQDQQ